MKRQENRAENGQNWGNLLEIQVLASRARGRRFKSCTAHHFFKAILGLFLAIFNPSFFASPFPEMTACLHTYQRRLL